VVKTPSQSERVREIWEKRIRDWDKSGLSQAEYCRRNGIRIKSFAYWKKKEAVQKKEVRLIPVSIPQHTHVKKETFVKVVLKNGYVIEVRDGFTPMTLREVVNVLEVV
jgi:hypothetical protein